MKIAIVLLTYLTKQEDKLIIVSGKTNSGKTTLLTALLKMIRDLYNRRIVRLGNPIEIPLENTVMVNASGYGNDESKEITGDGSIVEYILSQFMRHDPDVTVAEEVRHDYERKVALEMADKGHLTLVSSHATTLEISIKQFLDMESVSMSHFNSLIGGCVNQKLILKPCSCTYNDKVLTKDCEKCGGSGASGVLPVCDIIVYTSVGMDDNILDTQKLLDEKKAFGITKENCISYYKRQGLLPSGVDVVFVGDGKSLTEDL